MDREDVFQFIEENDVKFIRFQFTDIGGIMKNIAINSSNMESALDGVLFDGFAVDGFSRSEESEMLLVPELDTLNVFPWRPQQGKVVRFICDVLSQDGTPFEGDPRYILKKMVDNAAAKGYTFLVEPECEFFLFHTDEHGLPATQTHDTAGYFDLAPIDLGENARREVCLALENMGFVVESSHHEVSAGQHEIDFRYDDALKTADNIETFKMVVKIIAQKHGLHATFMPKPLNNEAGSGMHINMSLVKNDHDVFADPNDELGLSKEGYYFIGGVMKHIRGLTALFNPLVNSYKRLVPGNEAPAYIVWARKNRGPLVRIPAKKNEHARIELLSPDATCNPYLSLAALLGAGLEGIEKKILPPPELKVNIQDMTLHEIQAAGLERLPASLGEALTALEQDTLLQEILGKHAFNSYLKTKRAEWDAYNQTVHPWEVDRYLSIY
ncbi:MAG: type I glutamate--ammonia ligase [Ethanoligenens sp.]|uniref:type I glutamate--ammonia ligase n=1 Tax=Ethanoligenens sp. TaxID=2099655 RepID=UPI0039ED47FA